MSNANTIAQHTSILFRKMTFYYTKYPAAGAASLFRMRAFYILNIPAI
ncbi:hypothetical protein [Morganella morganii IS15]|nr:hypothetical protein CSB69_3811 [Morganella morganii]EMP51861.1 hypothetical protein C790_00760 [Morganella morganii SC01]CDK64144.1 hypothetical protein [Morganella morganii IS15]